MSPLPAVPPRLRGPRLAVWASFAFDGRVVGPGATKADWPWAMSQWDRVAQAGGAVRLVVADQAYSELPLTGSQERREQLLSKIQACRAAEQLVFGRVYAAGGRLPLTAAGELVDDPFSLGQQVPTVMRQISAWQDRFGDQIDGIYLDEGPRDCTDPVIPGSEPAVPGNYAAYVANVRSRGYRVVVQAAQYPDDQGWLRNLGADFIELWEGGVLSYQSRYRALDPCDPDRPADVPAWWDPGPLERYSRVHVIDDCKDVAKMTSIATLAVDKRTAGTIWITQPRRDPDLGSVYDVLPPFWDDLVTIFRHFAEQEERRAKDIKDQQDTAKDEKDATDEKDSKDAKDTKEEKDNKDGKDGKDEKDSKDEKDGKETKDDKDDKDGKDSQDVKDGKDSKDEKDAEVTPKQEKDGKDIKDVDDKEPEFLKDSETDIKGLEVSFDEPEQQQGSQQGRPEDVEASGRTFIRPHERPVVGARIVADPTDSDG